MSHCCALQFACSKDKIIANNARFEDLVHPVACVDPGLQVRSVLSRGRSNAFWRSMLSSDATLCASSNSLGALVPAACLLMQLIKLCMQCSARARCWCSGSRTFEAHRIRWHLTTPSSCSRMPRVQSGVSQCRNRNVHTHRPAPSPFLNLVGTRQVAMRQSEARRSGRF